MPASMDNPYNPNPITKFFITFLVGLTVLHQIGFYFELGIVLLISFLFYKNDFKVDALKGVLFFGVFSLLPALKMIEGTHTIIKMFFMLFIVFRMFYLPYFFGKFLIKTSDVGSIISSMDKVRLPRGISIPVAVMFLFFPSFKEEKDNIRLAMKIRGISFKNPVSYMEYVIVPLLVISSNIADDIAKAAETRCIENPVKKTRYIFIRLKVIDFVYPVLTSAVVIGGWLW